MGHMLSTVNPDAAARIGRENDPLPGVGTIVHYRPRPTDVKRGRWVVPAIVLTADQDNRTLDLFVIYDANDQITQERVPESPGDHERGWARIPSPAVTGAPFMASATGDLSEADLRPGAIQYDQAAILRADLTALREQVFGDNEPEDGNLAEAVLGFEARIAKLEKAMAKGKPGRPKGWKKPKPTLVPDAA